MCLELLHLSPSQPENEANPWGGAEPRAAQGNGARVNGLRQLKIYLMSGLPIMEVNEFLFYLSQFELGFLVRANKIV